MKVSIDHTELARLIALDWRKTIRVEVQFMQAIRSTDSYDGEPEIDYARVSDNSHPDTTAALYAYTSDPNTPCYFMMDLGKDTDAAKLLADYLNLFFFEGF